ncbi:MAG TPA: GNAT family N-acetyltransferase [Actinomycetota bacterium]|jgi:GNAT superfamily N-acetyltransferase|nr:GNAT family N-acetyltransferase [Actinomycetota bacterium]
MGHPTVQVRPLGPEDEDLLDAALQLSRGEPSPAPDLFLGDPRTHAFVALEGRDVVGWAFGQELLRPEGRWTILLYEIGTTEEARRRRVGHELLEAFAELARSRGHQRMWLYADAGAKAARALYPEAGGERAPGETGYWWVFA